MYAALVAGQGDLAIGTRVADGTAGRPVAGAPEAQRPRRLVLSPAGRSARHRSDERLLHDPPRDRRAAGAASVAGRLQDPRRRGPVGRRAAEDRRSPLRVPQADRRRIEADAAGRARLSRPRRPSRERRAAADPIRAVRPDRRDRPRRPYRWCCRRSVDWVRPAGFQRRPDRRDARRDGAATSCSTTRSPIGPTAIAALA